MVEVFPERGRSNGTFVGSAPTPSQTLIDMSRRASAKALADTVGEGGEAAAGVEEIKAQLDATA
jgi:hypothetical protein